MEKPLQKLLLILWFGSFVFQTPRLKPGAVQTRPKHGASVPSARRKIKNQHIAATLIICLIFPAFAIELIILRGSDDSAAAVPLLRKITTADSARIISPPVRSVLNTDSVVYEIELIKKADSAALWVQHSQRRAIEMLGTFNSPPYKTIWRNYHAEDQDQIH